MSKPLNEIVNELMSVCWDIDEAGGEIDEGIEAELDAVEGELVEKVNSCLTVAESLDGQADVLRARSKRLAEQAKSLNKSATRLRGYVLANLESADIAKLPTLDYPRCGVRNNPPKAVIIDEVAVLGQYYRIVPETKNIDKKGLLEALKAGEVVEGAELEQSKRLNWK